VETCPSNIDAKQEVHISGDVAFAILQYVRATGDHSLIADEGFGEILMGLGDFWISMLTLNKSSCLYEIHGKFYLKKLFRCRHIFRFMSCVLD